MPPIRRKNKQGDWADERYYVERKTHPTIDQLITWLGTYLRHRSGALILATPTKWVINIFQFRFQRNNLAKKQRAVTKV